MVGQIETNSFCIQMQMQYPLINVPQKKRYSATRHNTIKQHICQDTKAHTKLKWKGFSHGIYIEKTFLWVLYESVRCSKSYDCYKMLRLTWYVFGLILKMWQQSQRMSPVLTMSLVLYKIPNGIVFGKSLHPSKHSTETHIL